MTPNTTLERMVCHLLLRRSHPTFTPGCRSLSTFPRVCFFKRDGQSGPISPATAEGQFDFCHAVGEGEAGRPCQTSPLLRQPVPAHSPIA